MKRYILTVAAVVAVSTTVLAQTENKLTKEERKEGYKLLFNGKNTDGWHLYNNKAVGAGAWSVVDGTLTLDNKAPNQGDLTTNDEYENFELKIDWKISQNGNSGIIFPSHEDTTLHQSYLTGMEMQVLDDVGADDNKKPNHLAGSLYDMIAPAHAAKPAGEWNSVKIKKLNGHVTFWLNGEQVVDVQIGSPEWNDLLQKSKFRKWKAFMTYPKGHIALQDHGYVVSYRNVKIRQL
jgi:hypothetical protein